MSLARIEHDPDHDAAVFAGVQGVDDDGVGQGVACEVDGFLRRRDGFGVDGVEAFLTRKFQSPGGDGNFRAQWVGAVGGQLTRKFQSPGGDGNFRAQWVGAAGGQLRTEVDLLGAGLGGADQRDGEEGDSGR